MKLSLKEIALLEHLVTSLAEQRRELSQFQERHGLDFYDFVDDTLEDHILNYLGVPADTTCEKLGEGFCRDYYYELFCDVENQKMTALEYIDKVVQDINELEKTGV